MQPVTGPQDSPTQINKVVAYLEQTPHRIIAVDGDLGAGKTQVASRLAAALSLPCIHLDDYLARGREAFLGNLDYENVERKIDQYESALVIEGVCLLAVLARLHRIPDYLIFVEPEPRFADARKSPILVDEVQDYFREHSPRSKANAIVSLEQTEMTRSTEVDIAYIRAKTTISIVLALGGLVQTIAGALLLNAGLNDQGTASFSLMGAQFSATGLGGIVLCTSVLWAYFAYRSSPKYSHTSETKNSTNTDGSSESYVFESATQAGARPRQSSNDS
jgi:hypothetical protein